MPRKLNCSVRLNLTIPHDLAIRAGKIAEKEKRSVSNLTAVALEKFCDSYERKEKRANTTKQRKNQSKSEAES